MKKTLLFLLLLVSLPLAAKSRSDMIPELAQNASEKELKTALNRQKTLAKETYGDDKETLLMLSLQNDRDDSFIKILISFESEIDAKNAFKKTVLMYACENETHLDVIERMIKTGTILSSGRSKRILRTDENGLNCFDYALKNPNSESVISLLKKYAKDPRFEDALPQEPAQPTETEQSDEAAQAPAESDVPLTQPGNETAPVAETAETTAPTENEFSPEPSPEKKTEVPAPAVQEKQSVGVAAATFTAGGLLIQGTAESNAETLSANQFTSIAAAQEQSAPSFDTASESETAKDIPEAKPYKQEYLMDYAELDTDEIPLDDGFDPESLRHQFIPDPDKIDKDGRTLLMKAARDGNIELLEDLLYSQADVELKDNDGWTALMFAARFQTNPEIVKALLKAGAKPQAVNDYGLTALILAAGFNTNSQVVSVLLENRSVAENEVISAFIYAVSSDSPASTLSLFLEKGIAVNSPFQGKTPLMYACDSNKDTATIEWLLAHGAKTHYKTADGKTAFDFARENPRLPHNKVYWSLNASSGSYR